MEQAILKQNTNKPIYFHQQHKLVDRFAEEIHAGLSQTRKQLSPKHFYDKRGSMLFDKITELPEYYPTRTEIGLLKQHAQEFAEKLGQDSFLFELGSGSSQKIRLLLEAIRPNIYVPMDISKEHLIHSSEQLSELFPWLTIHALRIDYSLKWQPLNFGPGRYNAFFPGSSIGNFEPEEAIQLLKQIAKMVGKQGGLLIGVDLKKDISTLEAAYNDSQGVTAEFNKNLLVHINKRLNSDINLHSFEHKALYNETLGRIEMHLISQIDQVIEINGHSYSLSKGESIHTENSYKYSIDEFHMLARKAGFVADQVWTDENNLFSIHYLKVS